MRHMRSVGEEEGGVTAQPKPSKPPILGLLAAQCLGAFNDNVYKMVVSLLAVNAAVSAGGGSGALSLISVIFILPFFLFSGYAGYAADACSKRTVLVVTKAFEIGAMGLGFFAFLSGRIELMLGVLFLMALQATFFSPAKYGILPELLPDKDLSRANGLLEMSTFLAILLGTSLGSMMFVAWKDRLGVIGLVLVVISIAGTLASLGIPKVPPAGTGKSFRLNPWAEILSGLRRLSDQRVLWLTVVGISYFWFLGALLQMDILLFGKEVMGLDDLWVGILGTCLAIGIGLGSLMAGRLSGDKVELGLVPLGSIGIGVFSLLLSSSAASYPQTAVALALLGFSGGLFVVPLNAFLQQKSGQGEKGRLIATTNFLNTVGILLASAVLWVLRDRFHLQADWIILILGLFTLLATVYVLRTLPDFLIRFTLWLFTHTVYRIRIVGQEHVPFRGPALLVCNHMSFVDGLLVGACVQRFIRFLIYRPYYEMKSVHWLLRLMKAIPVQGGRPKRCSNLSGGHGRRCGGAMWSAFSPKGRLAGRAISSRSKEALRESSKGWTSPSFRCTWIRCGAVSLASKRAGSSGNGPDAFPIRSRCHLVTRCRLQRRLKRCGRRSWSWAVRRCNIGGPHEICCICGSSRLPSGSGFLSA